VTLIESFPFFFPGRESKRNVYWAPADKTGENEGDREDPEDKGKCAAYLPFKDQVSHNDGQQYPDRPVSCSHVLFHRSSFCSTIDNEFSADLPTHSLGLCTPLHTRPRSGSFILVFAKWHEHI